MLAGRSSHKQRLDVHLATASPERFPDRPRSLEPSDLLLLISTRSHQTRKTIERADVSILNRTRLLVASIVLALGILGLIAAPAGAADRDFEQSLKASKYAKDQWPGTFSGFWMKDRETPPRAKGDRYFMAFTKGAAKKARILEKRFPLQVSKYVPKTKPNTWKRLTRLTNRIDKYLFQGNHTFPEDLGILGVGAQPHLSKVFIFTERVSNEFRLEIRSRFGRIVGFDVLGDGYLAEPPR